MVIMASGIARGCVRTTATTTVESRKMAVILQIIGWKRQAALVYYLLFWYMTSYNDQQTPVKSSYPLTSITSPYRGLKFRAHRVACFIKVDRCPKPPAQTTRQWLRQVSLTWAHDPRNTCTWSVVNFKKHVNFISDKPEAALWSRDTGQRYPVLTGVNWP